MDAPRRAQRLGGRAAQAHPQPWVEQQQARHAKHGSAGGAAGGEHVRGDGGGAVAAAVAAGGAVAGCGVAARARRRRREALWRHTGEAVVTEEAAFFLCVPETWLSELVARWDPATRAAVRATARWCRRLWSRIATLRTPARLGAMHHEAVGHDAALGPCQVQ